MLGAAGLLKGKRAACHWAWRELLPLFGAIPDPARVVRDGNIITGGGVTAGIDFALVVAAEIGGEKLAQALQLAIEYAPDAALRRRPAGNRAARNRRFGQSAARATARRARGGGRARGGAAVRTRVRADVLGRSRAAARRASSHDLRSIRSMRDFLIDTDTASDDAVAILMALAAPDVRVLGLTTVAGNVGRRTGDAQRAADRRDRRRRSPRLRRRGRAADAPASRTRIGSTAATASAIAAIPPPRRAPEREHAVDAILRLADAEPGLTLVTLGPLTNVALALARDPGFAKKIGRCVVMGGAPCCEGNVTPAAEYNIWVDPEAARVVFRSGLPIEMVGWHVSRGASVLSEAEIADILALGTAKARFAIECNARAKEAYHVQTGERGLSLADPTAMAVALDRAIGLTWSRHVVEIECASELTRGMTIVDRLNVAADDNNRQTWRDGAGERRARPTSAGRSTPPASRRC